MKMATRQLTYSRIYPGYFGTAYCFFLGRDFGMRTVAAKLMVKLLTQDSNNAGVQAYRDIQKALQNDTNFFAKIVSSNES